MDDNEYSEVFYVRFDCPMDNGFSKKALKDFINHMSKRMETLGYSIKKYVISNNKEEL